ncbi:MAG: AMP-binding protein [Castellaniella sp.]
MNSTMDAGLHRRAANHSALTPLQLLQRSALIYPHKTAVIDGDQRFSYADLYARSRRLASALESMGVAPGDRVAILCRNRHEMLEAHYGVPMAGAVLNALNTRLDAASLGYILAHGEARVLIHDAGFAPLVMQALAALDGEQPALIRVDRLDERGSQGLEYEAVLTGGAPDYAWHVPADEWDAISLNYTSGTTGRPKGVVYHHRGAYLSSLGNAMAMGMTPDTVYLWTLPMFHCNGWCYTWAVTAMGGTHVCLDRVASDAVHEAMLSHGVTHLCGAPVVLNSLINDFHAAGLRLERRVCFAVGGAAPHSATLDKAKDVGFDIIHLYGLTETYGPASVCVWQEEWKDLPADALARQLARQGVGLYSIDELTVLDPGTGRPVPADAATMGELCLRGNTLMKGYLKDEEATGTALRDGWFHTGDLGVLHPDGYVEIRDRIKDIIISGGENISSHEVENVLYDHPAVLEAAVVAQPDPKWGEVPCAFVTLKADASLESDALLAFCRRHLSGFKVPKRIIFGELPKTSTGKIQKNKLRETVKSGL